MSSPSFKEENSSRQENGFRFDESQLSDLSEHIYSFTGRRRNNILDEAISGLNSCLKYYEEKGSECERQLEAVGFSVKDLPEDLRRDLQSAFEDNDGVFDFPKGTCDLVRISSEHVLDSLQKSYELGQMRMLSSQMESLVEELRQMQENLERKLRAVKEESENLENKRFEKEAELIIFNEKLDSADLELKKLRRLSNPMQKPKYSIEEVENMKQELNQLKDEIAFTNTKLNKYNGLPLNEKDAHKHFEKTKEELKKVDEEIRRLASQ